MEKKYLRLIFKMLYSLRFNLFYLSDMCIYACNYGSIYVRTFPPCFCDWNTIEDTDERELSSLSVRTEAIVGLLDLPIATPPIERLLTNSWPNKAISYWTLTTQGITTFGLLFSNRWMDQLSQNFFFH